MANTRVVEVMFGSRIKWGYETENATPDIFLDCNIVAIAPRKLSLAKLGHQVNRGLGNLLFTVPLAKENVQFLTYFNAAVWLARSHVKHFGITGSVVYTHVRSH